MPSPYRVALLGFTAFERDTLASCFRLEATRDPAYEPVESLFDAQLLLVDADQASAVRSVIESGRAADAVFIGSNAPEGATAWMIRPIDPRHVLRELDAIVAAKAPRAAQPPALPPQHASPAGRAIGGGAQRPAGTPGRRAGDPGSAPQPSSAPAAPAAPAQPTARALLVDDSAVALRFLQSRLQRYGLATVCVATSGKAIEELAAPNAVFDFVFLDVELGNDSELDGLALCQYIKRQRASGPGEPEPLVTLVSAHQGHIDRARGSLAGADAYLGKPIDEQQLHHLLQQRGLQPRHTTTMPDFLI